MSKIFILLFFKEDSKTKYPQLSLEAKVLKNLKDDDKSYGFPNFYWFGSDMGYNVMAFELLGPCLEDLFNFCGRKFSLKTSLMIIDQMVFIH